MRLFKLFCLLILCGAIRHTEASAKALEDFEIKIKADKESYADAPLLARVVFQNNGSKEIKYFDFQEGCFLHFYVRLSLSSLTDGVTTKIPLLGSSCSILDWPGVSAVLKP